jgi:hypothetical protein
MSVRTVYVPLSVSPYTSLAWPSKDPNDALEYALDCTAWLADAGLSISSYTFEYSTGLILSAPSISESVITVEISGGTPLTSAVVGFIINLSNGNELVVYVSLPIRADISNLYPYNSGISVIDDSGNRIADDTGRHLIVG